MLSSRKKKVVAGSATDRTPIGAYAPEVVAGLRRMITQMLYHGRLPARISILAALREEGVTYTSLALATTLASDLQVRVCAVELNWQSPGMPVAPTRIAATPAQVNGHTATAGRTSQRTALAEKVNGKAGRPRENGGPGLAGALNGTVTLDEALVATALPNLSLLPAGSLPPHQHALMARSDALKACIEQLGRRFDHLILDVPAILSTSDAIALASLGTAGCMVVRHGVTPSAMVRQALDEVKHLPILGVVMNRARLHTPRWIRDLIPQE